MLDFNSISQIRFDISVGLMLPGMVFTVEPCICEGSPGVRLLDDGWTVVTLDNSRTAQFEHTIVVNDIGIEILTL